MQTFYDDGRSMSVTPITRSFGLCPVLRVGQCRVLVRAGAGREDPEGVDSESGSKRQMDQGENAEDDGEHAPPGLVRQQCISCQDDAADAGQEGEQRHRPETGQPHGAEGTPAEIEVRVAEVAAEETVKDQNAKQPREDAKPCIYKPQSA